LPDGLSGDLPVQPLLQKDSGFRRTQIKSTSQPSRPHKRGVSRSSRTLGTGCGGRGSVRRAAARGRVMLISRTVKSCGPDAPTLASSFRRIICAGDGGKKARSPGRARSKPLKPLRREGRVKPVDLAATTLVCHQHFAHEAAGAAGTRLSLRPLFFEAKDLAQLGRIAPRDRGRVSYAKARHCEERSDEAIHSFLCAARWITSRSLSSGAHSRDPLARNDGESRARPRLPSPGGETLTAHDRRVTPPRCEVGDTPAYGEDDMTTNVVNLDALIPREDLAVDSGAPNVSRLEKIDMRHLEEGFFLSALRKPDFQRETAHWAPAKVHDLVRAFVDGDLIPAIILWQSGKDVFIIDGAHRMSALLAWVHNDYGDGKKSTVHFEGRIPEEQKKIADRTRKLIHSELGSYADYLAASKNLANAPEKVRARVGRLATNSLVAQWVPASDAKSAEDSFFKINQAATPIDRVETTILRARTSANAISARAIVRAGTGHKYWGGFTQDVQTAIESTGQKIHSALYDPPLGDLPIKTLDVPVAGRGYNALPFVFDLVNQANGIRIIDAPRKEPTKLPEDKDGTRTIEFLKRVNRAVDRITTAQPESLGLHPIVYFYTLGGAFQPATFIGATKFIGTLEDEKRLRKFTETRRAFEDFLLQNKSFISKVVHKFGSGDRSADWFYKLYMKIFEEFSAGKTPGEVMMVLGIDRDFAFLTVPSPREASAGKKSGFSRGVKTAAFFEEALPGAVRCSICRALLHRNSMHVDHIERRRDQGSNDLENAAVSHPYCNSTGKG
jgi:hypothetical protein